MASEQSIRITARGEFSQLENGLKNLQKDLKSVLGEIDKGARKGGFFDNTQLRALDVYRTRFKSTMDELNKEFQKQNDMIDQLHKQQSNASKDMQKQLQAEIDKREKLLDRIRRQLMATEDLYDRRNREASGYRSTSREDDAEEEGTFSRTGGYHGGGGSMSSMLGGSMLSKLFGMGSMLLGLAGIGGIASTAMQSYQLAYNSQVMPMNLSQRLRGYGYAGSAKNMWDEIGSIGRSNGMGYTSEESWNFQDMLSRQIGAQSPYQLQRALMFGRAYGLETGETAQGLGNIRALGGASSIDQIAGMVSASVDRSGMTPRILEVLQTSAGLLASMNTTLKDDGAKQILAYQTTLDTIGNKKGMQQLTGAQGANIIQGLGGIFNPSSANPWQWMGIQALQQYNPQKYGKMGLYDLQTNFEDGLLNTDNLPAMVKYLRNQSGGNTDTLKRMIQQWLQQGGYNATKQQVNDLYGATDGFSAFDSKKINAVMGSLSAGDGTAKYQERMGQLGQQILDTNSRFEKDLENLGQPLLEIVQTMKGGITSALDQLTSGMGSGNNTLDSMNTTLTNIKKFMDDNLKGLATGAAIGTLALAIAKIIPGGRGSSIIPLAKTLIAGAVVVAGAAGFSEALGDKKQGDAMASKAGIKGGTTIVDRTLVDTLHKAGVPKQKMYDLLNPSNEWKPVDKWVQKTFPDTRSSAEKAYDRNIAMGKTGDGKHYRHLSWENYANPDNWGKGTVKDKNIWQKISDWWNASESTSVNRNVPTAKLSALSDEGKKALLQLQKDGLISIGDMSKNGTVEIQALSSEGKKKLEELSSKGSITLSGFKTEAMKIITTSSSKQSKELSDLQKNGSKSLNNMDKTTNTRLEAVQRDTTKHLDDVKSTHKDFVEKTTGNDGIFTKWASDAKGILQNVSDWWHGVFGGSSSSSGSTAGLKSKGFIGSNIAGLKNYHGDMNSGVSASKINSMLKGTSLAGHGQDFIDVGNKTGVDPALLVSMAYAEQGFKNPYGSNNFWGLTSGMGFGTGKYDTANDGQRLAVFPSIKAGIMAAATNLQSKRYLGGGNDTVEGISKTWTGSPYWGQEANNIYYMLGKLGAGGNAMSGVSKSNIAVTVKLTGDQVASINSMSQNTLRKTIQEVIKQNESQRISLNPSIG